MRHCLKHGVQATQRGRAIAHDIKADHGATAFYRITFQPLLKARPHRPSPFTLHLSLFIGLTLTYLTAL
jgi:hypothetical protein